MSAFAVAIEAKSDIAFCGAYVCFRPKADIQGALKPGDGRQRAVSILNLNPLQMQIFAGPTVRDA
jgi:hypothetical protein